MDNTCSTTFEEVDCEIDMLCYEEFLSELKDSFNSVPEEVSEHLTKILKDCEECISQTFDMILDLKEKFCDEKKLGGLLENAIHILKMLARYLKHLETCSIACCDNKSFPTTTGNIIYAVFNHCKNSEQLYGIYLRSLESQLKDLFRTCHELQLIYLMIFEKYYVIDLDIGEEQEVLLASLEVNLNICDIAQSLDVKTMAEHWKAYTAICEKHALYLEKTDVLDKCITNVVATVKNNMNFEQMEDDKVITRSLKVTAFVIKILSKLANIFKSSSYKYENILELFLFLYKYKNELFNAKTAEHSCLIESLIISPADNLLKEILSEEFLSYTFTLSESPLSGNMMPYVIMLTSIMRQTIQNIHQINVKERLIRRLFKILPYCYNLFTNPSRLKLNNKCYDVYQYLLIHTVAFTTSFSREEYTNLERIIFQTLLSTDCHSAIFASDLWVILCRNNTQLQLNTLSGLIRMYQKLERNKMFQISPQKQYILHTIEKMFKNLQYDEMILIYRQCNVQDVRNDSVWTVMMRHLPDNIRATAENIITDRCLRVLEDFHKLKSINVADMNMVIRNLKLLSHCTTNQRDLNNIETVLVDCWLKCCPNTANIYCLKNLVYFQYVEALSYSSRSFIKHFEGISLEKIMHVVFKMAQLKNMELTLILFELCCELLMDIKMFCFAEDFSDDLDDILLRANNDDQQRLFLIAMSKTNINKFLSDYLQKDSILRDVYKHFEDFKNTLSSRTIKNDFACDQIENAFIHKCFDDCDVSIEGAYSQNDKINDLLELEEPVSKKAKTDSSVIEEVLSSIESKITQLDQEKEAINEDQKRRIKNICHKLQQII